MVYTVFGYDEFKEYLDINYWELANYVSNMLRIQDELNTKIDNNWKENRTLYDFDLAAKLEIAEFIESTPWKWWKKGNIDINNCKIELVDVWHFLLSLEIVKNKIFHNDLSYSDEKYIKLIYSILRNRGSVLPLLDSYITLGLDLLQLDFISPNSLKAIEWIIYPSAYVFNTVTEFIKLYYLKVGLNSFRQSEGYKTGEYKKYLEGKEDNEFLFELLNDFRIPDDNVSLQDLENIVKQIIV